MQNALKTAWSRSYRIIFTLLTSILLGSALIIVFTGENPLEAYWAMIVGALGSPLNIGTTLVTWTTLMLVGCGFAVASKTGCFNTGVEGALFIGAIATAITGVYVGNMPRGLAIVVCLGAGMIAGALWSLIPAVLFAFWNINMICVCTMLNMVALYITQYVVQETSFRAVATIAKTVDVQVRLTKIMLPSRLTTGVFLAVIVTVFVIFVMRRLSFGAKATIVGQNLNFAEYAGMQPRKVRIQAMLISGALCGLAGAIEIIGNYGYFQLDFASGYGNRGLLAAMIVNCDVVWIPLAAFFVSVISSGSTYLQQATNVPRFLADTLTTIFIILASMPDLFTIRPRFVGQLKSKRRAS